MPALNASDPHESSPEAGESISAPLSLLTLHRKHVPPGSNTQRLRTLRGRKRHMTADKPVPSLITEIGMGALMSRQVAGPREGVAAGGADVGADAGMGEFVSRQASGL